jgi:uncharacterized membrane protein YeaQ/YmgE (transglycosylase-associated protein family)
MTMDGIGIFSWIVIGLLAGWIASLILSRHHGLIVNLIIGLIGACIGGWINKAFIHFEVYGFVSSFIVAFAGSVILLLILGLINRPKST